MVPPLARNLLGSSPRIFDTLTPFVTADFRLAWWKIVVDRGLRLGLGKTRRRTGETEADRSGNGQNRSRQPPCMS
jgi:hypothetical protein